MNPRRPSFPFRLLLCLLPVLAFSGSPAGAAESDEPGFVALANGRDMSGFDFVGAPADTWRVEDGVIRCSGRPNGYFATSRAYRNFVLRLDVRYVRPAGLENDAGFEGNSGFLLHISGEPKIWPRCVEVQGKNQDLGKIFAIGGGPRVEATDQPEARAAARQPVGEWNRIEITSQDGAITARLNGVVVCTSEPGELPEGQIGFQSEGAEIDFRNLRIKNLP